MRPIREHMEGLRAAGVPVCDREATVLGALSVSGPSAKGEQFRDTIPEMVTEGQRAEDRSRTMRSAGSRRHGRPHTGGVAQP